MTNEIDKIKILSDEAGSIIKLKNSMLMKIRKNNNLSNDEKSYLFNKTIVQLNDVLTNVGMELSSTLESIPIYTFYLKNMTYLTIYERAELIAEIKDIERFYGYKKLDLIAVDYLQLLRGGKEFETRELETKDILKKLKILAIELEVPVIITAQVDRNLLVTECSTIEDYADFIIRIEDYSIYMKSKCMFFRMMKHNVDDIVLPMKFIRKYRCFEHIEIWL